MSGNSVPRGTPRDYGALQHPRVQSVSPAQGGGDREEQQEKHGQSWCKPDCVSLVVWLFIWGSLSALMIYYGPTELLRSLLTAIPDKPGWNWFLTMGAMTSFSIVAILPTWPPMCIAHGLIFGLFWGFLLNFASILLAAVVSLIIGRFIFYGPLRRTLNEGGYETTNKMLSVVEETGNTSLWFLIILRFLFIPMFVRNYGFATLDIQFWRLCVACVPHCTWISLVFASLGSSFRNLAVLLKEGESLSFKAMKWQQLLIFAVSAIAAVIVAVYAHRMYHSASSSEESPRAAQGKGTGASSSADEEKQH